MGTKNVQRTLGLYKVSALWVQVSPRPPLRLQFLTGTPPSIINGKTAVLAFSEVQMGRPKQHYWRLMFARFSQSSTDCGLYCCHSLKFDLSGSLAAQTCFKELCFKNSGAEGLQYSFGTQAAQLSMLFVAFSMAQVAKVVSCNRGILEQPRSPPKR